MIRQYCHLLLFCFLVTGATALLAQDTNLQQITKQIDKTFKYQSGYTVNVEGERAFVDVQTTNGDDIIVKLELVAQHPEEATAQKDLERWAHIMVRHKNNIYLRNYIDQDGQEKAAASRLFARYTIKVPQGCPVYLKNNYGETNVTELASPLRLQQAFSQVLLQNITGDIEFTGRYSQVNASKIAGNVNFTTRRSEIDLSEIKGNVDLNLYYTTLRMSRLLELTGLNIQAEHSDLLIKLPEAFPVAYTITTDRTEMLLPEALSFRTLERFENGRTIQYLPPSEGYLGVTITMDFGKIEIEEEKVE